MDQESRRVGLKWKIGGIYTGVMLVLGAFVIGAVYQLTQSTLRDQLDRRALAIATNFSDATAGYIAGRNLLALHALARKYTLLDGVARNRRSYLWNFSPRTSARTFCRGKAPSSPARIIVGRRNSVRNRGAGSRGTAGHRPCGFLG